jgi:hypothetical protein
VNSIIRLRDGHISFFNGNFTVYFGGMVETRAAPRYRLAKSALIEHGDNRIKCVIRHLSITGAPLELTDSTVVPAKFTLIVPEDRLKLLCRVVRRTEFRIDIAFE